MKSTKMLIATNAAAIQQALDLGINVPTPELKTTKLLFHLTEVYLAYINEKNNIVIQLISGEHLYIQYDKKLWNELEEFFQTIHEA